MPSSNDRRPLESLRRDVAVKTRALRTARSLTQAELAGILGMSQNRLSEVERGRGSFTAEQFLVLLRLFNVPASHFDPAAATDRAAQLQNALARLGASHLRESEAVLPSDELRDVISVVREALISGAPRLVTATAPVLVEHVDRAGLTRIDFDLRGAGLERRLAWVVENVLEAVRRRLATPQRREVATRYARAEAVLASFLEHAVRTAAGDAPLDVLDPQIRSARTIEDVKARRTPISTRWGIITRLGPEDFARALEDAGER